MGLSIVVGVLTEAAEDPEWAEEIEESFDDLGAVLIRYGLLPHIEPEDPGPLETRAECESFPHSYLYYLRRVYAHVKRDPGFVAEPLGDFEDPGEDPVLVQECALRESHLVCHSDCEGYYVPQDFRAVIIGEEALVPGEIVGSSLRLLEELCQTAPALGIRLRDGELSDEEAMRINHECWSDEGLHRELTAWIGLYEAARLSLESGAAIVFS